MIIKKRIDIINSFLVDDYTETAAKSCAAPPDNSTTAVRLPDGTAQDFAGGLVKK